MLNLINKIQGLYNGKCYLSILERTQSEKQTDMYTHKKKKKKKKKKNIECSRNSETVISSGNKQMCKYTKPLEKLWN